MTQVTGRPPAGKSIDVDDFADLTDTPVESVAWDVEGQLVVTFAEPVDAATERAVRMRITSTSEADEQMRCEAAEFLTDPTADVRAQVDRLTRIVLGIEQAPPPTNSNPEETTDGRI